jgi:nitrite reductase (NO-forming)/hydroxylamine reductase
MFLATHPESPHLWMDTPLSAEEQNAQSIAVFNKDALEDGYKMLPAAQWANLGPGPRRVLQPAFSQDGSEVWLVVWNPQDLNSAVLVIDDRQLTLKAVIRDPGLVTPTRIYSLAALMREGYPQAGTHKESSK